MQPNSNKPLLFPDILIIPLLSYDKKLYRLGYGKVYYDNTISKMKQQERLLTVGLDSEFQKCNANLPNDKYDVSLDFVVTESSIYSQLD